jgi:hypothetical protein
MPKGKAEFFIDKTRTISIFFGNMAHSGLHYPSIMFVVYNHNDIIIVIYNYNVSGHYNKTWP